MPSVILRGDPTDHGGQVKEGGPARFTLHGRAVALMGDPCTCPRCADDGCVIAEGDSQHTIDGIPVAYEGHKTSCGAVLIATVRNFVKA